MKSYPERLLEIGITLLEPYTKAKTHTLMRCHTCLHEWKSTPHAKLQSFKHHNTNGCPECETARRDQKKALKRQAFLARCPTHIQILSNYNGTQSYTGKHEHFLNTKCGHEFWTIPTDVIIARVDCPICGDIKRTTKRNINNHLRKVHDPETWKRYQNDCQYMSEKTYKANLEILNPKGYLRTLAGVEDGYQLDHILPKAIGYKLDIPPELMSHIDNLQLLPWEENRQHSDTIKYIPLIFREFFTQK